MTDWRDTASGVVGAVSCTTIGLPFDVAKARLQANGGYGGLLQCLGLTLRAEGPVGLYRGFGAACGSAIVENSVGITVNRALRRQLCGSTADAGPSTELGLGALTGVFTSIAICPMEVLKVRQQVLHGGDGVGGGGRPAPPLGTVLASLLRAEGARGLYRGLGSLVCRDVPFNALFFGSYESTRALLVRLEGYASKEELPPSRVLLAGGLAGSLGWSFIMPMDVAKTRLQAGTASGTMLQVMAQVVAREGWRALFTGWGAAVARAFPANAGLFLGVELTARWLGCAGAG